MKKEWRERRLLAEALWGSINLPSFSVIDDVEHGSLRAYAHG